MLELKGNFKSKYSDIHCSLGCSKEETQQHLLECEKIIEDFENVVTIEYEDIFSTITKQKSIIKIFQEAITIREVKVTRPSNSLVWLVNLYHIIICVLLR